MAVSHAFSNAVADAAGVLTIWYGATTATVNATDIVRPSDWNSAHNQYMTVTGNIAGQSTFSGTNIVIGGGPNITISGVNATRFDISAGAGGAGDGGVGISAGANSVSAGTVVFSNSNGISFGLNGSTVTAQHNALTTARASNDAVGLNTAQSNVTWTVNSAGLSLDARGYAGTGTTFNGANLSGSMTVNSNGVQLSVSAGNYLTSQSNQNVTAANGGFAFQTLSFSNLNGISFGTSAGSAITASHNALTTARASNDAIGLNTAQSNVTWTVNSSGLSFDARGYAGTGTTFNGANVSGSMTVNSVGVQLSLSAAAPGGGGTTNQTGPNIGVSNLGNTAGSTGTVSTGNVVFVGSNGITLSQSTGAVGSDATITIVGPQRTISGLAIQPFAGMAAGIPFAQSSSSLGQNTLYLYPFQVEDHLTLDHLKMPVMLTNSSSAAASVQKGYTYQIGLFTRVNATQISRVYSTSYTMAASHNSNASWMISIITAIGNSTSYNTLSASSAGVNLSSSLHGARELIMPMSTLLTPGEYFAGIVASTSSAGAGGNVLNLSNIVLAVQTYNRLGLVTATSNRAFYADYGMGVYSATTGAIPSTINITQINQGGTHPILFLGTGTV